MRSAHSKPHGALVAPRERECASCHHTMANTFANFPPFDHVSPRELVNGKTPCLWCLAKVREQRRQAPAEAPTAPVDELAELPAHSDGMSAWQEQQRRLRESLRPKR